MIKKLIISSIVNLSLVKLESFSTWFSHISRVLQSYYNWVTIIKNSWKNHFREKIEKNAVFLTLFDLFLEDLYFFSRVAIVASRIIKCQTVSIKFKDFPIQYCGLLKIPLYRKMHTYLEYIYIHSIHQNINRYSMQTYDLWCVHM